MKSIAKLPSWQKAALAVAAVAVVGLVIYWLTMGEEMCRKEHFELGPQAPSDTTNGYREGILTDAFHSPHKLTPISVENRRLQARQASAPVADPDILDERAESTRGS